MLKLFRGPNEGAQGEIDPQRASPLVDFPLGPLRMVGGRRNEGNWGRRRERIWRSQLFRLDRSFFLMAEAIDGEISDWGKIDGEQMFFRSERGCEEVDWNSKFHQLPLRDLTPFYEWPVRLQSSPNPTTYAENWLTKCTTGGNHVNNVKHLHSGAFTN